MIGGRDLKWAQYGINTTRRILKSGAQLEKQGRGGFKIGETGRWCREMDNILVFLFG